MRLGAGLLAMGLLAVSPLAIGCDPRWSGDDWTVSVYYTAVESYHDGPREAVRGCLDRDCTDWNVEIGLLPKSFIEAVRDEGTGRITSGDHAGAYLNWAYDTGFWLDTDPRDAAGEILEPFRSAAAAGLDRGTHLRLTDCGIIDDEAAAACAKFQAAEWSINDEFIPGLSGPHHLDLYVGEETSPGFTDGPDYVLFAGATVEPVP